MTIHDLLATIRQKITHRLGIVSPSLIIFGPSRLIPSPLDKIAPSLDLDPAGLAEIMAQLDRPACCDLRPAIADEAAILAAQRTIVARGGSVTILED